MCAPIILTTEARRATFAPRDVCVCGGGHVESGRGAMMPEGQWATCWTNSAHNVSGIHTLQHTVHPLIPETPFLPFKLAGWLAGPLF